MREVILTGFGPFKEYSENPSYLNLISGLPGITVLPDAIGVDIAGVDHALEELALMITPKTSTTVVHFGLSADANFFILEQFAYNQMPESGEKICPDGPDRLETSVPETLAEFKWSTDPGRYFCNYLYYRSLAQFQRAKVRCLFVHVPTYDTMGRKSQRDEIFRLIDSLSR
jgi:pyrrolidone-carboxylate peptidase